MRISRWAPPTEVWYTFGPPVGVHICSFDPNVKLLFVDERRPRQNLRNLTLPLGSPNIVLRPVHEDANFEDSHSVVSRKAARTPPLNTRDRRARDRRAYVVRR